MAKFKVGQQVYVKGDDTPRTIEWYDPKKGYAISGEAIYYPEEDIVAANKRKAKNSVAANAVTITKDSRQADNWVTGKVNGYYFEAKVYDEPSHYGINGGRVSKLWMRDVATREVVCAYDRGWSVRPQTPEAKEAMKEVLAKMKALLPVANSVACNSRNPVVAKALNACRVAKNGSFFCDKRDYATIAEVEDEYPGRIVKPATGGWMVFDTWTDYNTWKAQNAKPACRNARPAARNARLVPFDRNAVQVGDTVWYRGREFKYEGTRGGSNVFLTDAFDGEEELVSLYDKNLKMKAKHAARNATEAEVAQYLSSTKTKIRDEVAFLKAVAAEMKAGTMTPAAEKAYGKVVKAMASLQKAFAELA